eukprot:Seg3517.2 transcript_id=Seg3517.2/GoldUCD/mRNA.D3Y31 product="hypothetical protein" protein_id=Seg3517.2/GoldUCD/D3Y31
MSDGRYSVKFPWRKGQYYLPNNKQLCETRLKSLLKKLREDQQTFDTYDEVIKSQLEEGIVQLVPEQPDGQRISYLPHHGVIRKEAETTKLRIVYDASAKQRKYDKSLNDCLHIGPPLQPMLYDILLRFRMFPVAILGDVEKVFLQIEVNKEGQDAMRFLRVKDIHEEPPEICELRFTRVIFGSGTSPFLLGTTIKEHMETYKSEDPEFVNLVTKGLFIDDLAAGGKNTEEVTMLKQKLKERFNEGHFNMQKWKSNDENLRGAIKKSPTEGDTAIKEDSPTKVLGVSWNEESDEMAVDFEKICSLEHEPTQRGILRTVAAIYDPLDQWPEKPEYLENAATQEERRETTIMTTTTVQTAGLSSCIDPNRFNSGLKIFRVTAWVLRFINKARKKSTETSEGPTKEEIDAAEIIWTRESQRLYPPSKQQINQLGLRSDKNGVLRCHGRFNLQEDQQPVYIPKQHHLAFKLATDAHKRTMHMGVETTLAELRCRFWIPNGCQLVKKVIKVCRRCIRFKAKPFNEPTTAPIPDFRKTPGYAFQTTGVDFAGPFYYKDGKHLKKAYITPNHLIHGRRIKPMKEEKIFSDEDEIADAKRRLKYLQKHANRGIGTGGQRNT